MFYDYEDMLTLLGAILLIIILFFGAMYSGVKNQEKWDVFSKTHSCKVVSRSQGNSISTTGISSSGSLVFGSSYVPGKTGFLCDDGVTYYRDN